MFRQILAILLAVTIWLPTVVFAASPQKIEKRVHKTPIGEKVEVRLNTGNTVRGTLTGRSTEDFTVQTDTGEEHVAYQDVRSIHKVKPRRDVSAMKVVGYTALIGLMVLGLVVYATSGGSLGPLAY